MCGLLYATLWRYGYHRDELYFRMLPTQWGYVDQPFMTPLLAKASIRVFGDTVFGLRALAPLCVAAGVVLTALTTRELGGSSRAQAFAAWGYGFAALPLLSGHLLETGTLDLTLWTAALLFVTRALLRDERWWLASGAVLGLAADNKLLVVILVLALAVGIGAVGPRSAGRSPYLWGGALVGLALASPSLIYQVSHHFPQVTMALALHEHSATQVREQVVPFQVLLIGPPLFVLAVLGFVGLLRRPAWRLSARSRPGLPRRAAGQPPGRRTDLLRVRAARLHGRGRMGDRARSTLAARRCRCRQRHLQRDPRASSAPSLRGRLPGRTQQHHRRPGRLADVRRNVAARVRSHACLPTTDHAPSSSPATTGEAGAVDRYGQGLPPVYRAQNELYFHGPGPATADVVLLWTQDYPAARTLFTDCHPATTMDDGVGLDNEEQGSVVAVCRVPPPGWAALWPRLQHFD